MGMHNIWRLRRQPAVLPRAGKLFWWIIAPFRILKSLWQDIRQGRFAARYVSFVPAATPLRTGLLAAWLAINSKSLQRGPYIAQYERAFADYLGVERAVSFGAGRVALNAILKTLDIGPGDEVIIAGYTCVVVPNAIIYAGARPVYADIEPETYNISVETVHPKITERTKAIVVQHSFGLPAELESLLQLAKRHNLAIIEDCAAALGATYKGRPVGTWGDAAFFSTEHSKTISTETGGIAVATNKAILERLVDIQKQYAFPTEKEIRRLLAQFASTAIFLSPATRWWGHMVHTLCSEWFNFKPSTLEMECRCELPEQYYLRLSNAQARLGIEQLKDLNQNLAKRRAIAHHYGDILGDLQINAAKIIDGAAPVFVRFPFSIPARDKLVRVGAEQRIEIGIWFASVAHPPASLLERLGYEAGSCPAAERAAQTTVNLPVHPLVKQRDVDRITKLLCSFEASRN